MSDRAFFDTNVLVYALAQSGSGAARSPRGSWSGGGVINVQVLNEFTSIARRKYAMTWDEVGSALAAIRTLCGEPFPITLAIHEAAIEIARQHNQSIYDALIVAAALDAKCTVLHTEDLQDGRIFAGTLVVKNPFVT